MLLLATVFLRCCISARLLSWLERVVKRFYNRMIVEFANVFDYMRSNFLPIVIYGGSPIYPFVG